MPGVPDEHDLERLRERRDDRRPADGAGRGAHRRYRLGAREDQALLSITVREGRNRQVRKMCDAIGHPVAPEARRDRAAARPELKLGAWHAT